MLWLAWVAGWSGAAGLSAAVQGAAGTAPVSTTNEVRILLPLEYSVRRWTGAQGPPLKTVEASLQTRDGYLWFGMNDGLCRFDGVSFEVFDPRNTPALKVGYVTALAESPGDGLWIGSAGGGLVQFHNGVFTNYGAAHGLSNEQVKALRVGADGRLWIGTDGGGVFVRDLRGGFRHYGAAEGLTEPFVVGMSDDAEGRVFVVTYRDGPYVLENDRFRRVELEPPLSSGLGFALTRSPNGGLWLGTPRGVYRFEEGRFRRWTTADALPGHDVVVAWELESGDVWLGSAQGLALRRSGGFAPYPIGGGLSGRFASAFVHDREGSLWASTEGAGMVQLRRTKFVTLGTPEGLSGDEVTSVLEARDGALWIGTSRGLNRFAEGRLELFSKAQGLPDDFIFSLHEDAAGVLWVATRLGGLARWVGGRFEPLPAAERLPTRGAWCLAGARDGSVWVGTSAGAFQYRDGRRVAHLDGKSGLSNDDVRTILEDREGVLWLGTSYGLNRMADGKITTFAERPGGVPVEVVISLYADAANDLWIGTLTRGLFRLRAGEFANVSAREGLPGNTIASIVEDGAGALWLGTSHGIARLSRQAFDEVTSGVRTNLDVEVFARSAGLRTEECAGTIQPTAAVDRDGRLWFATTEGLTTTDPKRIPRNQVAPRVHIERLALESPDPATALRGWNRAGEPHLLRPVAERGEVPAPTASQRVLFDTGGLEGLRIPPGQDRIEFGYVGLSFVSPESVTFQYQLAGFDRDWVDAGRRRVAYYTRVPPGTYTFRVKAVHGDGMVSDPPAAVRVVVEPAWVQNVFLRTAGLVLAIAAVVAGATRRVRRLHREREAAAEFSRQLIRSQETERLRLAGELHDGLAQELQVIRNRAELAMERLHPDPNLARELLAISATATRAIRNARAMSRGLRPPELDQLGLTQALRWLGENVSSGYAGRFETRIEPVDGLLERQLELDVYRIAQEALNNAIKHGASTEITLEVGRNTEGFELTVFDNGRGFVASDPGLQPGAGAGLKAMRERAAMLRGTLEIRSEPGIGTRLTLVVPVPPNAPSSR